MDKQTTIREDLKAFILKKVKETVTPDKPYFFIRWSGLFELCKQYNQDILELIDELANEGKVKKAIIKGRLALTLPSLSISKKTRELVQEFMDFIKR